MLWSSTFMLSWRDVVQKSTGMAGHTAVWLNNNREQLYIGTYMYRSTEYVSCCVYITLQVTEVIFTWVVQLVEHLTCKKGVTCLITVLDKWLSTPCDICFISPAVFVVEIWMEKILIGQEVQLATYTKANKSITHRLFSWAANHLLDTNILFF